MAHVPRHDSQAVLEGRRCNPDVIEPDRLTTGAAGSQQVACANCFGLAQGKDVETIHQLTGCPRKTVQNYITDFEEGRRAADFVGYFGIDLGPKDLSRLHGTWHVHHGGGAAPA